MRRSLILVAAVGFAAILPTACGKKAADAMLVDEQIFVRIPIDLGEALAMPPYDFIADHRRSDDFLLGWMRQSKLDLLPSEWKDLVVILPQRLESTNFDFNTLRSIPVDLEPASENAADDGSDEYNPDGYHNYVALTNMLQDLTRDHPDFMTLHSAGKSEDGRELWYVKLSDNPNIDENEPKLLYIANMHGNEVIGREVMLNFIQKLANEYESNSRIQNLINHSQLFIMPSMNPDGFELGRRFNKNGIDLNRNFPDFTRDDRDSGIGRAAETNAIMRLHEQHHFVLAMNFHGGELCINIPWDSKPNPRNTEEIFGDDPLMKQIAREYADLHTTMHTNNRFDRGVTYGFEWFHIAGGMQDWSIYFRESIHATVELTPLYWPTYDHVEGFWQENINSLLAYLENGTRGVHIEVVDQDGNAIAQPKIRVSSMPRRVVSYRSSLINRPTLAGEQTVEVSADGYQTAQIVTNAKYFDDSYQKVVLERN